MKLTDRFTNRIAEKRYTAAREGASTLPNFDVVMGMAGAGSITGPKIMGEIGDVRRFTGKSALVAFAGVDASPDQSGIFELKSRRVSRQGALFWCAHFNRSWKEAQRSRRIDPQKPIVQGRQRHRKNKRDAYRAEPCPSIVSPHQDKRHPMLKADGAGLQTGAMGAYVTKTVAEVFILRRFRQQTRNVETSLSFHQYFTILWSKMQEEITFFSKDSLL